MALLDVIPPRNEAWGCLIGRGWAREGHQPAEAALEGFACPFYFERTCCFHVNCSPRSLVRREGALCSLVKISTLKGSVTAPQSLTVAKQLLSLGGGGGGGRAVRSLLRTLRLKSEF